MEKVLSACWEKEIWYTKSVLPTEKKKEKYIIFDGIWYETSNPMVHNVAWDEEQLSRV